MDSGVMKLEHFLIRTETGFRISQLLELREGGGVRDDGSLM